MAIGQLSSNTGISTLTYTGAPITDRFTSLSENQELILFTEKSDATKLKKVNSLTVSADGDDLYFTVLRFTTPENRLVSEAEEFEANDGFLGEPVFFVEAGSSIVLSGLGISGVKFCNNLGARYFIQGMSW